MKEKIFFACFSGISIIVSFILFVVRGTLVLSEYSQTGFSELIYYWPLTVFAITFAFFSVFFLLLGGLLCFNNRILLKKKIIIVICSVVVFVAVCFAVITSVSSVASSEKREHYPTIFNNFGEEQSNEEIPIEFEFILPFLNDINDYYSLKCLSVSQAKYIHTQNYGANQSGMLVYDVEYFESDVKSLMQQYIFQKDEPVVTTQNGYLIVKGEEKSIDGVDCIIYDHNNYLQIRIIDSNSCYSIVFDNLYDVSGKTTIDFQKIALDIYFQLR